MAFRWVRNAAKALSDPWPVVSPDAIVRRLMDGVLSAQTMGFAVGPMRVFQCYLQPPGPTPRPMAAVIIYAGTNKMLAMTRATLPGSGRYLDLTPLQQKTLGVTLPDYLADGQLPLWRTTLPDGDEQPDGWVKGFLQLAKIGAVFQLDLAPQVQWFSVLSDKHTVSDILLRHHNLIYHLKDENFPFGGHFIRLVGHQGSIFDEVAESTRG